MAKMAPRWLPEAPKVPKGATLRAEISTLLSPSQPLVLRSGPGAQNGPLGLKMAAWSTFGHFWVPVAGRASKQWIFLRLRWPVYAIFGHFELSESSLRAPNSDI